MSNKAEDKQISVQVEILGGEKVIEAKELAKAIFDYAGPRGKITNRANGGSNHSIEIDFAKGRVDREVPNIMNLVERMLTGDTDNHALPRDNHPLPRHNQALLMVAAWADGEGPRRIAIRLGTQADLAL